MVLEQEKVLFFRAYGLNCALAAAMGINGYVQLPMFHPWKELDLQLGEAVQVNVHGGVTYGPDQEGWIGFDTCHGGDVWTKEEFERFGVEWVPEQSRMFPEDLKPIGWERYWTVNQVQIETVELARQVAATNDQTPYHAPIWTSL